jgi:hypothetical protein
MLGFAALGLLAFPFPMRTDEVLGANTIHTIIWGVITPLLMLAGIGVSAAAFGKAFRVYALLTLLGLIASSVLTGILAGQVNAGGAAPSARAHSECHSPGFPARGTTALRSGTAPALGRNYGRTLRRHS